MKIEIIVENFSYLILSANKMSVLVKSHWKHQCLPEHQS